MLKGTSLGVIVMFTGESLLKKGLLSFCEGFSKGVPIHFKGLDLGRVVISTENSLLKRFLRICLKGTIIPC